MAAAGRILVVEDDRALAEAVESSLGARYAVRRVGTGADAIAAICDTEFELVLLGHRLPDLLGVELLPLIKRSFPTTTVVLMTGQGSEDVAIDALRGRARDYLRKPFSLQDLVKRVDALFAVRRKGDSLVYYYDGNSFIEKFSAPLSLSSVYFKYPSHIWTVGQNGYIAYSSDNGENWSVQNNPDILDRTLNDIDFSQIYNWGIGWAVGDGGLILKTTNFG